MSQAVVGRWGRSLAVRVPFAVAQASGLSEGETVDIETIDGDIVIRRSAARAAARSDAALAAAEIISAAKGRSLGDVTISDLLTEGRR